MLHNVLWLDLNFDVHSCSHLKGWFGTLISSLVVGSEIVSLNQPLCKNAEIRLFSIFPSLAPSPSRDQTGLTVFSCSHLS